MMPMPTRFSLLSFFALVLASTLTLGHHASNLDYDAEKIGTVEGVVDDIFWANPHIHFYLSVTRPDGATEIWDMEGPNLSALKRRGMSRDMVQIGDAIKITGTLGRDGTRRIWAETILKADGTPVMEPRP
jgi:Family of unknown function (DUF6152)